jgi:hypothetical protein
MFLNKIIVAITLVTSFALVLIFGCSSEESPYEESPYEESPDPGGVVFDEPWPDDLDTVLTANFTDGTGDLILLLPEQGAPPYSGPVSYPPVDTPRSRLVSRETFSIYILTTPERYRSVHITSRLPAKWKNNG